MKPPAFDAVAGKTHLRVESLKWLKASGFFSRHHAAYLFQILCASCIGDDDDDDDNDDDDYDDDDDDDDDDDVTDHHTGCDAVHIEKIEPVVDEAVSVPLKIKV